MTSIRFALVAVVAVSLALALGCGQRENPADPEPYERGYVAKYGRQFGGPTPPMTWLNEGARLIKIYLPPQYSFQGDGKRFPTLYLLHDFTGDQDYYLFSSINDVADRLIASGEIKPMVIVMPNASAGGLGTFCADGWVLWNPDESYRRLPGDFEKMIWDDLIHIMEVQGDPDPPFSIIPRRASRAIGGIGMGGYSALRVALKHPELFSSVSTTNGFLSFGDMIQTIMDRAFAENGVSKGSEDGYYNSIDTAYTKPFTSLLYSMAGAFSHYNSEDPAGETMIYRYQVDLPFDADGDIVQSVYDRWLANDLSSVTSDFFINGWLGNLDSTALYIAYSSSDVYKASDQASTFMDLLDDLGISYENHSYSGYPGYPETHDLFRIERIEEILKFHSRHLSDTPTE